MKSLYLLQTPDKILVQDLVWEAPSFKTFLDWYKQSGYFYFLCQFYKQSMPLSLCFFSYCYICHVIDNIYNIYHIYSRWLWIPYCHNYVLFVLDIKTMFSCLWVLSGTYKTKQYPNLSLLNGLLEIPFLGTKLIKKFTFMSFPEKM